MEELQPCMVESLVNSIRGISKNHCGLKAPEAFTEFNKLLF